MASDACSRSTVSQNYHQECEEGLNAQIQLELQAMYTYISMASHFQRADKALEGFAKYFSKAAQEEMGHVETLSKYQNKRGGHLLFKDIPQPAKDDWGSGQLECAALPMCKIFSIGVFQVWMRCSVH